MSDPPASQQPRGFRAQRRFSYPAPVIPPEWTAPTPPHGIPVQPAPEYVAVPPDDAVAVQPDDDVLVPLDDAVAVLPDDDGVAVPLDDAVLVPLDDAVAVLPDYVPLPPLEFVALSSFAPVAEPPLDPGPPSVEPPTDAPPDQPKRTTDKGWRRWLHPSGAKATRHETMATQANRPLTDCFHIALLSLKGGVGKTTITATLGATFASLRDDRVIAVDANPDRGTLSQKVPLETASTVRHLLRDADGISTYDDVRHYTSQGSSRLEVLASESDPAVSEAFSAQDYDQTLAVLERFYNLVLTDCGTGLLHSAMSSVLSKADLLVVVSSGSVDGARSASATLDWLDAHGHEQLVRDSVAVVNAVRPRSGRVDLRKVDDHFARRCRAVVHVPFDPHLEAGAEIDLDRLKGSTRDALLELASVVADGFPEAPPTP